jgi:Flp pilus assembly protein TadD
MLKKAVNRMIRGPFLALLSLSLCTPLLAYEKNEDPNAAARRAVNPLGNTALADVERINRTNNTLAVEHFTKLIAKDPKDALSYARRGKAYAGLRDYEKAQADYDKAIELDPKLPDPYIGRAVSRFVAKDFDKSWEDVHMAESLGGEFWPAFMDGLKETSGRDK